MQTARFPFANVPILQTHIILSNVVKESRIDIRA